MPWRFNTKVQITSPNSRIFFHGIDSYTTDQIFHHFFSLVHESACDMYTLEMLMNCLFWQWYTPHESSISHWPAIICRSTIVEWSRSSNLCQIAVCFSVCCLLSLYYWCIKCLILILIHRWKSNKLAWSENSRKTTKTFELFLNWQESNSWSKTWSYLQLVFKLLWTFIFPVLFFLCCHYYWSYSRKHIASFISAVK